MQIAALLVVHLGMIPRCGLSAANFVVSPEISARFWPAAAPAAQLPMQICICAAGLQTTSRCCLAFFYPTPGSTYRYTCHLDLIGALVTAQLAVVRSTLHVVHVSELSESTK